MNIKNFCKKFILFLLVLLIFSNTVYAKALDDAIPKPQEANGSVYDAYQILNKEDLDYINLRNSELYNQTKGQIAVAIVKSLDGYTIEEYATKMFEMWQIGDKKLQNGVLLLISIGDGKIRIETGYRTEGFIPDVVASRIIRNIVEYFPQGDKTGKDKSAYREGIMEGYNEILQFYVDNYGINLDEKVVTQKKYSEDRQSGFAVDVLKIAVFLLLIFIINNRKGPRGRRRHYYGGSSYGGGSFFGGYYGGSGSGGSSSGGFSGGGGRSGGGGASGGW